MAEPQQSLSDAVASISTLPNELLQCIFGIVVHNQRLDDYGPYEERFPLRLTRVCRSWESLAIAAPCLWTTVLIKYGGDVHNAPLFINRADPCSFDIHIEIQGLSLRDTETIGNLLVTNASRLRTLKLTDFTHHEAETFTNLLSQTAWPALEVVDFKSDMWSMDNHVVPFVSKLNTLRSLTLKGRMLDFQTSSPAWSNLTYLNVRKLHPRLAQLQELFASAPQLKTLYLPCLERIIEQDELEGVVDRSVIDASSLRTLSVGMGHNGEDDCSCPLSYLRMPNLETLCVNGIVYRTVGNHFSRSEMADSLTTLRLSHMDITSSDATFYRTLHNVRRLELIATNDADLLSQPPVLAQQATSIPPFPSLASIAYFPDTREDISWLGNLTREMAPDRNPILVEVLRRHYAEDLLNELPPKTNIVLCTDPPGADFPLDEDDPFEMDPSEWGSEDDPFVDYEYDHDWYYSDEEEWYGHEDDFDDDVGLEDIMGSLA
ncbi:hypothetical protein VNI00_001645 [Paramarasmius palmivorus]|uniref:F-box domain-containing protein n=1 Tax=Paramarasmius palmivorus TaxID=297713 RepID=A0AAW0E488_9AGAR